MTTVPNPATVLAQLNATVWRDASQPFNGLPVPGFLSQILQCFGAYYPAQQIDSVFSLRSIVPIDGQLGVVLGYYTPNDGGGGISMVWISGTAGKSNCGLSGRPTVSTVTSPGAAGNVGSGILGRFIIGAASLNSFMLGCWRSFVLP